MKILNQRVFCDSMQCSTFCWGFKTHFCSFSVSAEADFIPLMMYEGETWGEKTIYGTAMFVKEGAPVL